jgi:aspartyl-tRNA(Asn)/glutamyl-tRNA(Gln) amidotransferase subunit B
MNSFKSVYGALKYEEERQRKVIESGGRLVQETRGWVDDEGITVSQRSKEFAHDYRYFPEPDLPPLVIAPDWVEEIRRRLPELPDAKKARFMVQYKLSAYDAELLTGSREFALYFESCVGGGSPARAKMVANWMLGEYLRLLNDAGIGIAESKVSPGRLSELLDLIEGGTLSTTLAKQVFEEMFRTGKGAGVIIAERGLTQISGAAEIEPIIERVIRDHPKAVAEYKAGKTKSFQFLVGQVMKETRGRAKPDMVNKLLEEKLR